MRSLFLSLVLIVSGGCGAGTEANPLKPPNENHVQMGGSIPGTSAEGPSYSPKPRPDVPENCPLVVGFASYGAGIDREAFRSVMEILQSDPAVLSVDRHPWGREGEVSLCVTPRSEADSERLFHRIKAIFPAKPRGPLGVRTRSGLKHRVSWNG